MELALFFVLIAITTILPIFLKTTEKRNAKLYLIIMFVIIGALMMLRSDEVGNDTITYVKAFKRITRVDNIINYSKFEQFEKGFTYLMYGLSKISVEPQILFIVTGGFVAFSFARFIYKYSDLPWLSVFMFLTLQFYDLSLTGVRQILSIAIMLFSYDFIQKRQFWRFLILVLLAMSIHTSAVMFLLLYILASFKPNMFFYGVSFFVALVGTVSFSFVLGIIGKVFPQYLKYFNEGGAGYSSSPKLACALMMALFAILLIISFIVRRDNPSDEDEAPVVVQNNSLIRNTGLIKSYVTMDDVMLLSIWLGILMLMLSLNGTILNRFKYIFSVPILVYYPNSLMKMKDESLRLFIIAGSCVVFFLYIYIIYTLRPDWQSSYPYTFFWQVN